MSFTNTEIRIKGFMFKKFFKNLESFEKSTESLYALHLVGCIHAIVQVSADLHQRLLGYISENSKDKKALNLSISTSEYYEIAKKIARQLHDWGLHYGTRRFLGLAESEKKAIFSEIRTDALKAMALEESFWEDYWAWRDTLSLDDSNRYSREGAKIMSKLKTLFAFS